MYRVAVCNRIKIITKAFQFLGWWDADDGKARIRSVKFFLFFYFASCPVSLLIGALTSEDKEESVFLTAIAISVAIHVIRLFYILWRNSEILTFILRVSSFSVEDQGEFNRVNRKLENFIKFVICFATMITTALVLLIYGFAREKKIINIAFPLDYKSSEIGFWIALVYLAVQAIYCVAILLLNVTIWYLMLIFAIEYELLGNQMRHMGIIMATETGTKGPKISEAEQQNLFYRDLIAAIEADKKIRE